MSVLLTTGRSIKLPTLMHKINPQSLVSKSLFAVPLTNLIPKDHPKRIIIDKLPWDELTEIAQKAYKSHYWKGKPNARVMAGLFVWHCVSGDKPYREIKDDFSFNRLCMYACGFKTDEGIRTVHHTTLIKFEEHLGEENILKFKDIIEKISVDNQPPNSKGRHSSDSTVFESNITYPTDTKIMESARLFLVNDIIKAYEKAAGQIHRTYNRIARKKFLGFAKKRKAGKKEIRAIKKTQLQHLRRNIGQAEEVMRALQTDKKNGRLALVGQQNQKAFKTLKHKLEIAKLIYSQQLDLYKGKEITDRIVSFHRPNIRPVFRGKAQKRTEFGVKTELSLVGKALVIGKISYANFYDGKGLKETITNIKNKGYPIKEIIGDKGNGGCCQFLKEHNIVDGLEKRGKRVNPPPIPKKRFIRARNRMEGAIGVVKNVFIKNRIRSKTDFGDLKKICKASIGYNLTYAW